MQTRSRRAVILVFDGVEVLDVAAPVQALALAGRNWNFRAFRIELVAEHPGPINSLNQLRLEAPHALSACAPADVVVVPGGYGARQLIEQPELLQNLARIATGAELVAGIGWGVAVLAAAGLVGDRRVAVPPRARETLAGLAPDATLDPSHGVVLSGALLTAAAGGAALDLGITIIERTFGPRLAAMVRNELFLEDPNGSTYFRIVSTD
ncbi:MAG: DJ-1/PfpI family protein [Pseudomonadota bacterium]